MPSTIIDQPASERGSDSDTGPVWRRILSIVLAVLAVILIVLSMVVVWANTTIKDEDTFVSTLESLPSDDAVATALSIRLADRIIERTGVNDFVFRVLPDPLGFLATPLTATISNSVTDIAYETITSERFTSVWVATLRTTHRAASVILSGNDAAIVSEEGTVAIDLNAIADLATDRIESRGITLPDLDVDFGEIVLYESDQLAAAQSVARTLDTAGWFVPLLALIMSGAALWLAPDRRWMVMFLGFATALGTMIALAGHRTGRQVILGGIEDHIPREAGFVVWNTLLARLLGGMWAVVVLALIVGIVAWTFGPSARAQRFSAWASRALTRTGSTEEVEPTDVTLFFSEWKRPIEIGVVSLSLLFILFGPAPSALLVVVTAVFTLVAIGAVEMLAGPSQPATEDRVDADA